MITPSHNQTSDALQEAVSRALQAGDFDTARLLSVELGAAIRHELSMAPPAGQLGLYKERMGRLQEHISLARVLRAHLAAQLQTSTAVCLYQESADRGHCWRFDA
jgi:hypothetical protein